MRVVCVHDRLDQLAEQVRGRVRKAIRYEDDYAVPDLVVGREYPVQAVEIIDGAMWFRIHIHEESAFPHALPAEMFVLQDAAIPPEWVTCTITEQGVVRLKRLTFPGWDEHFVERLVDEGPNAIELYRRWKRA